MPDSTPTLSTQTPEGGIPIAADDHLYLKDPLQDASVRMLVELSAQLWVERERRMALEMLLERQGIVTREAVEKFAPDATQSAELKAARSRFIDDVFKELRRIPLQP